MSRWAWPRILWIELNQWRLYGPDTVRDWLAERRDGGNPGLPRDFTAPAAASAGILPSGLPALGPGNRGGLKNLLCLHDRA